MAFEIKIPRLGESISSGVLGSWRKQNGELVHEGDVLAEIETDKVTSELHADQAGVLQQTIPEGTEVQIGQTIGLINGSQVHKTPATPPPNAAPPPASLDTVLSPAVRHMMEEKGLSPGDVQGTGKAGRILKADILEYQQAQQPSASHSPPPPPPPQPPQPPAEQPTPPPPAFASQQPENISSANTRTTRRKISPLRKKIADRLLNAQHNAAILTTFNEADMSQVIVLRKMFQERFMAKYQIKLGFMSFFVQAVVHALKSVPQVNARIDGDEIVENHFYDIGVALGTDKGLVVPVLKNADRLSLADIERGIAQFIQKNNENRLTLEDLEGGVFTISNGGVYGSLLSTPILNPPQSGILGMHTIQERPVASAGKVEIRPMMYLALSYDHRLVDGKQAVTFLVRVKEFIEQPALSLLGLE